MSHYVILTYCNDVIFSPSMVLILFPCYSLLFLSPREIFYALSFEILFVLQGSLGQSNMSWEVSLTDVNAGMPRTVEDMYGLKEQSLYLIKVSHPLTKFF